MNKYTKIILGGIIFAGVSFGLVKIVKSIEEVKKIRSDQAKPHKVYMKVLDYFDSNKNSILDGDEASVMLDKIGYNNISSYETESFYTDKAQLFFSPPHGPYRPPRDECWLRISYTTICFPLSKLEEAMKDKK